MDKSLIINEIDMILDTYCNGCFLKKQLVKDNGKSAAHRFCIDGCTVGDQLKFLGSQINKMPK